MNWMDDFIARCLADVPPGKYRTRTEKELRDHMETQRQFLSEAEVLQIMGDPDQLCGEYKAAWARTVQARLACASAWAKGEAVMLGVHCLVSWVISSIWRMAISLPASFWAPQLRMIRNTLRNLNNTYLRLWLPLVLALAAGAFYLGRKFRTSRFPAVLISAGLSCHWALAAAFNIWWEALDDHRTFWAEFTGYVPYNIKYFSVTFAVCILLGVLFGLRRKRRLA